MKSKILILSLFISISAYTQDKTYARSILDTLCSAAYDGRGYYNDGERRAAEFIKGEYERHDLRPIQGSYFQHFNLSANSIKGTLDFKIGKKSMKAGKDFIISPSSSTYEGESAIVFLKKSELINIKKFNKVIKSLKNKFVVVDQTLIKEESREVKGQLYEMIQLLKNSNEVELNGVIELTDEKLTYTASQEKSKRPHLIVLKEAFPNKQEKIKLKIESHFDPNYQSQNVIGMIEGEVKDSFIYIVGHYDHLGRMGDDTFFPGANDNASGIAMLLSLAKDLAKEQLKYSIVFISFGAEEIGLVGSKYYTENPILPLEQIKFLVNLDILGTGDDGIRVVNGSVHQKKFDQLVQLNEKKALLKQVKIRGKACNSDHCYFSEKGVPGFFIYTLGGIAHYHNIYDKSETLPLTEYDDLFILLKEFVLNI